MPKLKLTKTNIEKLPLEPDKQRFYHDTDIRGFGVCVGKNSKTYFVQRDVRGRTVRTTIDRHGVFTAEMAREEARKLIVDMVHGINPNTAKQNKQIANMSLGEVLEAYCTNKKTKLKPLTLSGYRKGIELYLSDWLTKPLADISKQMVATRHAKIAATAGEATANGSMRILRAIYNYALALDDKLPENPVIHLSRTRSWYKNVRRRSFIKPHQLKPWYDAVMDLGESVFRDYLLLLLFTGMRRSEAAKLKWSDIDFADKTITLRETKNGETLVLPMSDYLFEIFACRYKATKDHASFIFISNTRNVPIQSPQKFINKVTKKSGVKFMCHDLRRTFITIAESMDISAYALKYLLNHKTTSDITGGYIVLTPERMREPMQKISEKILCHIASS